jgi:hypothetical protein
MATLKPVTEEFRIDTPVGQIIKSNYFEVGDIICQRKNYESGLNIWFKATAYDVEYYSGRQLYYKLKFN